MREFELLQQVFAANAGLPARVTIPPGDDMGAVRLAAENGGGEVLVTVDQVADGVHFDLRNTPLAKVGRKAMTRNLSDVAAMAARPVGAVVAACLPKDFGGERAKELYEAMRKTGEEFGCPIIGGDTGMWDGRLILSVTILAEAWPGVKPVLRRGAKVGDGVYVTGKLGGSLETVAGHTHHLDFTPRLAVAKALAAEARWRPHAMIDLSDGLSRDLGHICELSGVSAVVEEAALPLSPAALLRAKRSGEEAWKHGMGDGEDYELCFAAGAEAEIPAEILGVAVTRVGEIVPARGEGEARVWVRLRDGEVTPAGNLGWEHAG